MDGLKEIVHEGWLIKSPPPKLWKARWRQRWFVLRHSGELPGQYFLEYYADRHGKKLKGKIDLDQCEQVDAGLSFVNRKEKYNYMFNVKTPKRIYYLVADSEDAMNKWVDAICQVCCLKAYTKDDEQHYQMYPFDSQESPPVSPSSIMSGPYIPISECISGPRLTYASSLNHIPNQFIQNCDVRKLESSPPRSPMTDADSIITDDEFTFALPNVNWDTFPTADDLKPIYKSNNSNFRSWNVTKRFSKMDIADSNKSHNHKDISIPPRPPKLLNASECPGHNYLNLDGAMDSSKPTSPSTPEQIVISCDKRTISPLSKSQISTKCSSVSKVQVFDKKQHPENISFDINTNDSKTTPPIFRELKPRRKINEINSNNEPNSNQLKNGMAFGECFEPPRINRKLKRSIANPLTDGKDKFKNNISPSVEMKTNKCQYSSVLEDENTLDEEGEVCHSEDISVPTTNQRFLVLQYIDLDLEPSETANAQSSLDGSVYKTIDFLKTKAFNETRQKVEEERKQCSDELP